MTTPESGFFHLLDFSAMKGKVYSNEFVHYKSYGGWTAVKKEDDITNVLGHGQNLRMASGGWSRLGQDDMIMRVTFAMPVADIFEMAERVRRGMKNFVDPISAPGYKPEPVPA